MWFIKNCLTCSSCRLHNKNSSAVIKNSRVYYSKKYWVFRYINTVRNCGKTIDKIFPKFLCVYRIFRVGTEKFYYDFKAYRQICNLKKTHGLNCLRREELQLSFTFPRDCIKIAPVLLLSAIPFTNYIILPLIIYYPCLILTSHYWSIQDKLYFILKKHERKIHHEKLLLQFIQCQINTVDDSIEVMKLKVIIAQLGSGTHPSINDIVQCKKLFSDFPYSLKHIKQKHCNELLKLHRISPFGMRKKDQLKERGLFIKKMDLAIKHEGGVKSLSSEDLRWALSFRGINPANISVDDMKAWLDCWLFISSQIDYNSISLLLHCPVLLAYSQEANWTLLCYDRKKINKYI